MLSRAFVIFIAVIAFFLGFAVKLIFSPTLNNQINESRLSSQYKFVSPLLECESSDYRPDNFLLNLKEHLQDYLAKQTDAGNITNASIYYRDLSNGPWFGINEYDDFSPASLIKVPLMMTYLKLSETDDSILNRQLIYTATDSLDDVNIKPSVTLSPDQSYSVKDLIVQMISYSDNASYNLLNQNISADTVLKVYNDLGVNISKGLTNPNGDILSVKSYASFFRILFNASYLNKDTSEEALKILSQSQYQDGLVAGIPKDIIVAHKFGERQFIDTGVKQLHDCGIVYLPGKPYLLCIMTRGQDFSKLSTTISEISSRIYKEVKP